MQLEVFFFFVLSWACGQAVLVREPLQTSLLKNREQPRVYSALVECVAAVWALTPFSLRRIFLSFRAGVTKHRGQAALERPGQSSAVLCIWNDNTAEPAGSSTAPVQVLSRTRSWVRLSPSLSLSFYFSLSQVLLIFLPFPFFHMHIDSLSIFLLTFFPFFWRLLKPPHLPLPPCSVKNGPVIFNAVDLLMYPLWPALDHWTSSALRQHIHVL